MDDDSKEAHRPRYAEPNNREALPEKLPDASPLCANTSEVTDWSGNYFNYFTEIEDQFQRSRGTGMFLLSPLDWALIESWKNAEVPLAAVLHGIDDAFTKWRTRKNAQRLVNSLAYCTQAVMRAAERTPARSPAQSQSQAPFTEVELRAHLDRAGAQLRQRPEAVFHEIAESITALAATTAEFLNRIEELERRLTALEDKMVAAARSLQNDRDLYAVREALDRELRPYRGKMTADQIVMLERRYLDTALLERCKLPRLSLFYLH